MSKTGVEGQLIQAINWWLPSGSVVENPPANAGDVGLISGLGRSPGEVKGNPLQYSCLENPVDRGAWRATVHGITKSWTPLKQLSMHAFPHETKSVYIGIGFGGLEE